MDSKPDLDHQTLMIEGLSRGGIFPHSSSRAEKVEEVLTFDEGALLNFSNHPFYEGEVLFRRDGGQHSVWPLQMTILSNATAQQQPDDRDNEVPPPMLKKLIDIVDCF